MPQLLQRYEYPAQQDVIELFAPNFVRVKFGNITLNEDDNTLETQWMQRCLDDMKQRAPGHTLKILMDFSSIDSGEYNSKESNNLYRAMLKDPAIERVAAYGLHSGWQLLVDLLRMFVPNKLKTFSTEQEALKWLELTDVTD